MIQRSLTSRMCPCREGKKNRLNFVLSSYDYEGKDHLLKASQFSSVSTTKRTFSSKGTTSFFCGANYESQQLSLHRIFEHFETCKLIYYAYGTNHEGGKDHNYLNVQHLRGTRMVSV